MPEKRILIIEDEKELASMLRRALTEAGYTVLIANDGEEGLAAVKKEKPNLILLDVMMPKMNGYEVCRELKRQEESKKIPIIMLTAKCQESDRFWGKETGADQYFIKPFVTADLLKTITDHLGK